MKVVLYQIEKRYKYAHKNIQTFINFYDDFPIFIQNKGYFRIFDIIAQFLKN
jgi:hypothetical protein